MTGVVRLIAMLFFVLAFLFGITLGAVELGLINAAVFCALALAVLKFAPERWGSNGLVYGMGGAFFVSLMTPFVLYFFFAEEPVATADSQISGSERQ